MNRFWMRLWIVWGSVIGGGALLLALVVLGLSSRYTVDPDWYEPASPVPQIATSPHLAQAQEAAEKRPSVESSYRLGLGYLKEKRYIEAAQAFGDVLAQDPQHVEALLQLASIAWKTNERQLVLDLCSRAVQVAPHSGAAHNAYGLALWASGRPEEAEKEFQAAIKQEPNQVSFRVNLIQYYAQQGKLDPALQTCGAALQRHPRSADLYLALGNVHSERKETAPAIAAYKKVVELSPSQAMSHYALGLAYLRENQEDKALPCFLKAAQLAPQLTEAAAEVGDIYIRRGQYEVARKHLLACRDQVREPSRIECGLGIVYEHLGQIDEALRAYRKALDLQPQYVEAANNLAFLYAERGENLEQAQALAQQAVRLRPRDGLMRDTLGWVYYRQGKYDQALSHLRAAQNLQPDHPEIAYHLGMVYLQQGQSEQARQELERALRSPGGFASAPAARQALSQLKPAGNG